MRNPLDLSLKNGEQIGYHEKNWIIKSSIDLERILLEDRLSGKEVPPEFLI